jgi:pimeloyl-ACP methyl ester carboxylesterase
MQTEACTHMEEPHIIRGAGHWVQQEKPSDTSECMLAFLKRISAFRAA